MYILFLFIFLLYAFSFCMHFPDLDSFLFNPTIYSLICCIPFLNCFPKTPVVFNFSLLFICFQVSFFLRFMFLTWFVLISLPLFFPFLNNFWTLWYLISVIYSSSDKSSPFWASILLKDRGKLDSAEAVCLCWGRYLHQFLAFWWLVSIPWNPMTHSFLCYDVSTVDSSPLDTSLLHQNMSPSKHVSINTPWWGDRISESEDDTSVLHLHLYQPWCYVAQNWI